MRSLLRSAALLGALAVATAASADAPAQRLRPRSRRSSPVVPQRPSPEAATATGLATLRAPGSDAVLLRRVTFTMGSTDAEVAHAVALCQARSITGAGEGCREELFSSEIAAHEVLVSDFWLDRREVTVSRYRQCVAAGRCLEPPYASGAERFDRADYPVVLVTYNDAATFCDWAGGRLPTEAEWERAARGVAGRRYPWGNVYNPHLSNHGRGALYFFQLASPKPFFTAEDSDYAWDLSAADGYLELGPVGAYPDGRTPDGIDDLAGNVEEWVADYYAPEYPQASQVDPRGPDAGDERVVRGGSFAHATPWLRAAARDRDPPNARRPWRGFRCARAADPRPAPYVRSP